MITIPIFDTHCHLIDKEYDNQDIKKIIQEAKEVGVRHILNVGYDTNTNQKVIEQLRDHPSLFGTIGLHPDSNDDMKEERLALIESQLTNQRIIALGEIGLEYYNPSTDIEKQKY